MTDAGSPNKLQRRKKVLKSESIAAIVDLDRAKDEEMQDLRNVLSEVYGFQANSEGASADQGDSKTPLLSENNKASSSGSGIEKFLQYGTGIATYFTMQAKVIQLFCMLSFFACI